VQGTYSPEKGSSMCGQAVRGMCLAVVAVLVSSLATASSASADCERIVPSDPQMRGIHCTYGGDPESDDDATPTWRVPPAVDKATFQVWGGDAIHQERAGGYVRARLRVARGETLGVNLGFEGRSTWVSRSGAVLLLAGGAEDQAPNFVAPEAEDVSTVPSGAGSVRPNPNGAVIIEWQIPDECVVPRLRGRRLPGARRLLRAAHCQLGKVSRLSSQPGTRVRVVRQSLRPGTIRPRNSRVDLTLGRRP
jgi:hypothetical protein